MSGRGEPDIGGWLKNSFIDFPGTVSTVLFFNGCNLRCPYCHNPDLVHKTAGPITFDNICHFLEQRRGLIEGVVLSGGEPTLQREALLPVVERIRRIGLKVKLDTNGLLPEVIAEIAPDYLALDIKTLPSRYGELWWRGGDPTGRLEQSIDQVRLMGADAEVRITVAAPFTGEDEIVQFPSLLQGVENVYLQPFRNNGNLLEPSFGSCGPDDGEYIDRLQEKLATVVGHCEIRGG